MPKRQELRVLPLLSLDHDPDETPLFKPRPKGGLTRHHMVPKCRKGKTTPANLVLIPERVHVALHQVFGTMTPEEIVAAVVIHLAPLGYFDVVVLQQNGFQITLTRAEIERRRDQAFHAPNVPSFQEGRRSHSATPVYRRKRKRHSVPLRIVPNERATA